MSIAIWTRLVKGIERDKALLLCGHYSRVTLRSIVVSESSEAAQDKVKKGFEELTFEIGKESIRDYVARAKALVIKTEQHSVSTTKTEVKRRILNGLPSIFDVEKKMFLMMADIEPGELGKALARIEDSEGRKYRRHPCPGYRCKAASQRPGARRRGSRRPRRPWRWWSRQARRQRPSAPSTAVGFTAPRATSAAAAAEASTAAT